MPYLLTLKSFMFQKHAKSNYVSYYLINAREVIF